MGAAVAITRDDYSADGLRAEARRAEDSKQACRLLALAMVLDGVARKVAAEACGMDRHERLAESIDGFNPFSDSHGAFAAALLTRSHPLPFDGAAVGAPGCFLRVSDDTTLLLPERQGNQRVDSMQNLMDNPNIGLIFFLPGVEETLRIRGRASITRDRRSG